MTELAPGRVGGNPSEAPTCMTELAPGRLPRLRWLSGPVLPWKGDGKGIPGRWGRTMPPFSGRCRDYPARSCPGRGTGKGYRKVGEGQSPQFPEEAVPSPRHQHLVGTRGVLWAGAGGYTVGRGPRWPTYWPGTAGPTWWPARCARTWGSPVARQWAGVQVADVLARDRRTTQGPVLWTHVGVGEFWRAGHLTGVRGGRRTGPGLPVKCGGPVLWTHAQLVGRRLRAGCLVKSRSPVRWSGTVNQTRWPCPGPDRRLVRNMCAGRLVRSAGTSSLGRDFTKRGSPSPGQTP